MVRFHPRLSSRHCWCLTELHGEIHGLKRTFRRGSALKGLYGSKGGEADIGIWLLLKIKGWMGNKGGIL